MFNQRAYESLSDTSKQSKTIEAVLLEYDIFDEGSDRLQRAGTPSPSLAMPTVLTDIAVVRRHYKPMPYRSTDACQVLHTKPQ